MAGQRQGEGDQHGREAEPASAVAAAGEGADVGWGEPELVKVEEASFVGVGEDRNPMDTTLVPVVPGLLPVSGPPMLARLLTGSAGAWEEPLGQEQKSRREDPPPARCRQTKRDGPASLPASAGLLAGSGAPSAEEPRLPAEAGRRLHLMGREA